MSVKFGEVSQSPRVKRGHRRRIGAIKDGTLRWGLSVSEL